MRSGISYCAVGLLLLTSTALAQVGQPNGGGHRGTMGGPGTTVMPPQILDRPAAQPAPVVPDTVEIIVAMPDSLPQPKAVWVVQDTLTFGGLLHLVLDFPTGQSDDPGLQPVAEGEWLVPHHEPQPGLIQRLLGQSSGSVVDLSGLPETDGLRIVRSFRVYRRDPLQIRWQQYLSPVLVVVGQTAGAGEIASIRRPRSLAWTPWRLILLALVVLAVGVLAYWLWRRRQQLEPLTHWEILPPAWLAAAVGLQVLMNDNLVAKGDSREFLDRLASLVRAYVASRYGIAAREMTGPEMTAACAALGHDPAHPTGFARLVDVVDRSRYNPTAPEPAFCREQAVQFLGRVGRVRISGVGFAQKASTQLAAEKAWASLAAELGMGAGRAVKYSGTQEGR